MQVVVPMARPLSSRPILAKRLTPDRGLCPVRPMTTTSERVRGLTAGQGDGWGVYHRARSMKEAGVEVADLTIGEHDVRTDPSILAAMDAAARGGHTGYSALAGTGALRRAIAERVTARTGAATGPDNVLVTTGGQAALFAAIMAATETGDAVLYPDPYYVTYPGTVRAAGACPVPVRTRPEDGFLPRAADLAAKAGPRARALLINTPNNPSGAVYDNATVSKLADLARARDLWIISDEVYDTQLWSGTHLSPRALPGMNERTLVVGSLSKSHAMTGSRIGWLIGPEDTIAELTVLMTHVTYGIPGFIQDAGLFALDRGRTFEEAVAAPFRRRRDAALDLVARQGTVTAIPSGGAMYLMLDIRPTGLDGTAFAGSLLDRHRIAVMPGESFGEAAAGHVRVALTLPDERLLRALSTLLAFAKELSE